MLGVSAILSNVSHGSGTSGGGGEEPPPSGTLLDLSPDIWIDGNDTEAFGSSVDNLDRIIENIVTKDGSGLLSTPLSSGALRFKPSYNGEAHYFNGQNGYTLGSASTFKWIHTSGTKTIYFILLPLEEGSSSTQRVIAKTVGSTTTNSQVGFLFTFRHQVGVAENTIRFAIMNAGGGSTGPLDVTCSNNSIKLNEYNFIRIDITPTTLTIRVINSDNPSWTTIGSQTNNSATFSSADAAGSMTVGGTSNCFKGYFKAFVGFNRSLTTEDRTAAEACLTTDMGEVVTVTDANIYFGWGQSNFWGVGENSALAEDLTGNLGSKIFFLPSNGSSNKTAYWSDMEVGVTTNPSNSTQHGFLLRFAKEMSDNATPAYIVGRGIGSTVLIPNNVGATWSSITTINANDHYPYYTNFVVSDALEEIKHVLRKNPVVRGLFKMQGESDAGSTSLTVQADYTYEWEAWIKNFADFLNTLGYDTSKMRVVTISIKPGGRPNDTAVVNADADVMTNFLTNNPSYASKVKGTYRIATNSFEDSSGHFTAAGHDSIGQALYNYYSQYVNE